MQSGEAPSGIMQKAPRQNRQLDVSCTYRHVGITVVAAGNRSVTFDPSGDPRLSAVGSTVGPEIYNCTCWSDLQALSSSYFIFLMNMIFHVCIFIKNWHSILIYKYFVYNDKSYIDNHNENHHMTVYSIKFFPHSIYSIENILLEECTTTFSIEERIVP